MTEIIATVVITVSSALLFGYWFRYTCLLMLSAKTARDYAASFAMANQLGLLEVQAKLRERATADLDALRASLDRDYSMVSALLKAASNEAGLENHMLAIHFRLMRAWYGVSRRFSASAAFRALDEMSQVVSHFANAMGEQAASAAAA